MKRIVSLILAFAIVMGVIPMGGIAAWAAPGDFVFTEVAISKVYENLTGVDYYIISITGRNFFFEGENRLEVGIMGDDGMIKSFTPNRSTNTNLQYKIQPTEISGDIYINGEPIDISEGKVPTITNKKPTNGLVDGTKDAKITLTGSDFNNLKDSDSKIEGFLFQGPTNLKFEHSDENPITDKSIESKLLSGKTGNWNIRFEETKTIENLNNAKLIISNRYLNMFSMINKLDVSEEIDLIPTQGPVGSTALLQADELKPADEMSVFFLKSLDDPYLSTHMGTNANYRRDNKLGKDIFSFTVPKALEIGSYYVVLTNNINPSKDIKGQIKSYKVLDSKFIVIDSKSSVLIDSIDPPKGSAKGVDGTIKGQNIARLSPNVYEGGTREGVDISESNKMLVKYKGGKYKVIGENGVEVKSLEREIRFIIGGEVTFREGSQLDETVYDYINVRVGENFDREKLKHDIVAEISTTIIYEENGEEKETNIFETHTLKYSIKNGFTYEPLDYQPEIISIKPSKIPVDNNLEVMDGLEISIIGKNFSLYRYMDIDGKIKYKYPKFDFGGQFTLDPNIEDIEIKIQDNQGNQIDGTEGNDLGSKILLTIPSGKTVKEDILDNPLNFKLTNPIMVPESEDEGASATHKIQFVKPEEGKRPINVTVIPNVIRIGKNNQVEEETVRILGRNFERGVVVIIDGEEIEIERVNDTELKFISPNMKKGKYKITVQNPEGGAFIYDNFIYTQTQTDIKIADFNPKRGTNGMIITMIGDQFKKPDPSVKDIKDLGIYDLIGTRIKLGGKDINEYNKEAGNIVLEKYTSAEDNKILTNKNKLQLSDYYHSVIMQDENDKGEITRYTLSYNLDTQEIELLGGHGGKYILSRKDEDIVAKKDGKESILGIGKDHIELDGKKLIFYTPYKIIGEKIVGNRVRVINENPRGELIFTITNEGEAGLKESGNYDVVAINPDMNSMGGKEDFYYESSPMTNTGIDSIYQDEGPTKGGYNVTIKGSNFSKGDPNEVNPKDKTSVYFGIQKVKPEDIRVVDSETMIVKVPKYNNEIKRGKHSVVVSVLNSSDGGSSLEYGFKYRKNTSEPIIKGISPGSGSTSGGRVVNIRGEKFSLFEPYGSDIGDFTDLNNNGKWDDLRDYDSFERYKEEKDGFKELIVPILPKVYFGSTEVEVIDFDHKNNILKVIAPPGELGTVDVKVMNNDMGWSEAVKYLYEGSKPKISRIHPKFSPMDGGQTITVDGENFDEKNVEVQIGNKMDPKISNINIKRYNENHGEILTNPTQVDIGDLTVKYDTSDNKSKLILTAEKINDEGLGIIYSYEEDIDENDINGKKKFIDISNLKNDKGESYPGYEKIRIYKKPVKEDYQFSRIVVDRGFSPQVTIITNRRISFKAPSHYDEEDDVTLTLINPDGSIDEGKFDYKAQKSNLVIKNIFKRLSEETKEEGYTVEKDTPNERKIIELSYDGGIDLSIIGKDFRKTAKVTLRPKVNNPTIPDNLNPIKLENIKLNPKDSLSAGEIIVEMGSLSKDVIGHEWILEVTDEEGGSAGNSEDLEIPVYIKFVRSSPLKIESINPNFGPTAGGTKIEIKGEGFKDILEGESGNEKLRVYFIKEEDGISREVLVPQSDIISANYESIVLRTPAFTAGQAYIKVINLTDGRNDTSEISFNYVSNPKITSVVNPENDKFVIEAISVEGGEKIKVLGNDFMEGARVVFNPVLELVGDESQVTGDIITIDDKKYILKSGVGGTEVERIDGQTILVTTPGGKLGDKGVIVINPDQGATNVYNIVYGIPEIASPFDVRAEIVFDQFIRVNWTGPKEAVEYEIYMSEKDGKFEFIGTTELTSYAVQKLKPNTKYQFLLKAMGKYGASKPIDEAKSNIVTTGKEIGPIDESGKTGEKTKITISGTNADIIIGSKDFTSKGMIFDLTRGDLRGAKDITIRMPANIIASSLGKIQVIGKDYKMDFAPNIFKTSAIEDNKTKSNAGVVFKIASHNDNIDIKPGSTVAGGKYKLEAVTYVDKSLSKMDHLNGKLNFTLDQNALIVKNRKLKTVKTVRYDDNSKTWVDGNIANRLGLYTVIGSRR